jgi:hypothetical protein
MSPEMSGDALSLRSPREAGVRRYEPAAPGLVSFRGATFEMTLCISGDNFAPERIGVTCGWEAGVKNTVTKEIPLGILPHESPIQGLATTTMTTPTSS